MEAVLIIITDKTHTRKERSFHKSNGAVFTAVSRQISRVMFPDAFEWTYMPRVRK